jgi:3-deoxy-D-manno-octulosonic-acid transferase
MWLRAIQRKERPNWRERQGIYDLPERGDRRRVWVHTVSVGEFVASKPILRELRRTLPDHELVVSVTTSSGHRTAREAEPDLYDHLVYFPLDVARFQLAAMQRVRPDAVAIMETELWMNFLWAAKTFDAQTLLINGRISDRSYPRASKLKFFYRSLLRDVDRCLMQTPIDRDRIESLGAKEAEVLGNCKFDQALEGLDTDPDDWKKELRLSDKPVIVVGSTRGPGEEAFVHRALQIVGLERLQVIHAPRHLESVPGLQALVANHGLRSKGDESEYLILDTYGELSKTYAVADMVIIGGGFENLGGQNLIQPLAHGKPVLHGPHMQNFRDVAAMADTAGAAIACDTAESLAAHLDELLNDPARRATMGAAASQLVRGNVGASARYAKAIAEAAAEGERTDMERQRRRKSNSARG